MDSTRWVHHPAHLRAMEILRPGQQPVDLDTWFERNFDPGILPYLVDHLGLTPEELEVENEVWRQHTESARPPFYPGFLEAVAAHQAAGGLVVVVSHSEEHVIRAHYDGAADGHNVVPDLVFGWELPPEQRKPYPYPVEETMRRLGLDRRDVLVVDDLKPGIDMAIAAGVDAAAACWSHDIPAIRRYMGENCVAVFETVDQFASFIRGPGG